MLVITLFAAQVRQLEKMLATIHNTVSNQGKHIPRRPTTELKPGAIESRSLSAIIILFKLILFLSLIASRHSSMISMAAC